MFSCVVVATLNERAKIPSGIPHLLIDMLPSISVSTLAAVATQNVSDNGRLVPLVAAVKRSPVRCAVRLDSPAAELAQLKFDVALVFDHDVARVVSAVKGKTLEFSVVGFDASTAQLEIRLNVLSSSFEGARFRLKISLSCADDAADVKDHREALSGPLIVVSKPYLAYRTRGRHDRRGKASRARRRGEPHGRQTQVVGRGRRGFRRRRAGSSAATPSSASHHYVPARRGVVRFRRRRRS